MQRRLRTKRRPVSKRAWIGPQMTTDLLNVTRRTRADRRLWRRGLAGVGGRLIILRRSRWALRRPVFRSLGVDRAASGKDIPSALSVRQSPERTASGSASTESPFKDITIDRQFESGTTSERHPIGFMGGVVPGLRASGTPAGPTGHHRVQWEGSSLVFERGDSTGEGGVWTERREVWSLQPDGRLRVVITTRGSVDRPTEVTLMYRRPSRGRVRASPPW